MSFKYMRFFKFCCSVEKGTARAWSNDDRDILLVKYADKKDVHVLSTLHPHTDQQVKENVRKPTPVIAYNGSMGGVDKSDQV